MVVTSTKSSTQPKVAVPLAVKADDVQALRVKLQKISQGLSKMLDPKGALANSKIAMELQAFETEVSKVLKDTEKPKDNAKALKQLQDAQAGVKVLLQDMTKQQTRLMSEGDDQQNAILMGVLMTKARNHEAIEKQLEVMKDPQFANLPAVISVLAAKDTKTPLIQQVANYLDKHSSSKPVQQVLSQKLKKGKDGKPDVSPIVSALEERIEHLVASDKRSVELHEEEDTRMAKSIENHTKTEPKVAHRLQLMVKAADRKFKKEELLTKSDIASLKEAVEGVKKGDMQVLQKVQDALKANMKQMESLHGPQLYFLEMAHKVEELDCPYCAAQCIEKCSATGKSYVTCLTDCQDAGK